MHKYTGYHMYVPFNGIISTAISSTHYKHAPIWPYIYQQPVRNNPIKIHIR